MRVRRATALAVGALLVGTLTGCTFASEPELIVPDSGPMAVYPKASSGMDAALKGKLKLNGTCLVIVAEGGQSSLPVFPVEDATWDGTQLTYDGKQYAPGDEISVIGGNVEEAYFGPMTYIPADCTRDATFFVSPLGAKN